MSGNGAPLLELRNAAAGYGERTVLDRLSLALAPRDAAGVFAVNGSGKSTLLKVLSGTVPLRSGELRVRGEFIAHPSIRRMFREGVVYVPPAGRIFGLLTARENIELAAGPRQDLRRCVEAARVLFPELADKMEREAAVLSGGERQLLSIASALAAEPAVLLLDEPLLGLAPSTAARMLRTLAQVRLERGISLLLTDQNPEPLAGLVRTCYALEDGTLTKIAPAQDPAATSP